MQTFLPYADFNRSAQSLDSKRLGKQRVEVVQILDALLGITDAWNNHPAVRMWRGYERALAEYGLAVIREWDKRGYNDTCIWRIKERVDLSAPIVLPPWLGGPIHSTHRAALVRKDPDNYIWADKWVGYYWPAQ